MEIVKSNEMHQNVGHPSLIKSMKMSISLNFYVKQWKRYFDPIIMNNNIKVNEKEDT